MVLQYLFIALALAMDKLLYQKCLQYTRYIGELEY